MEYTKKYYNYVRPASGYKLLKWVLAPASVYVDTGIIPNSNFSIHAKYILRDIPGYNFCYGSGVDWTTQDIELYDRVDGIDMEFHYAGGIFNGFWRYEQPFIVEQNKGDCKIYSEKGEIWTQCNFGAKTFSCPYTMYIFALHRGSINLSAGRQTLFYFQMYNEEELVCNLIPVIRESDNKVGLYDKVTGNFLTGINGELIAGPYETVLEEQPALDYIQEVKTVRHDLPLTKKKYAISTSLGYSQHLQETGYILV